jgi:RNA 2',3'-cyclic 3'-phosphodiesterase
MSRRHRTFIGVGIDRFTRDRLAGLQERLAESAPGVKWAAPDNWHVTLLFLGEVGEVEVLEVCRTVESVCRDVPAFPMTLAGTGAFPTPRRPRTLIVNVTEGADELRQLHDALETPLLDLGCYRREERGYTPHLTLGRVRAADDPATLAAVVQQFAKWQGGQTHVREVLVMSSQLRPEGPEYTVLSRAKLKQT